MLLCINIYHLVYHNKITVLMCKCVITKHCQSIPSIDFSSNKLRKVCDKIIKLLHNRTKATFNEKESKSDM